MQDFSRIDTAERAREAVLDGRLKRILLLPEQLGGRDVPENVAYVPEPIHSLILSAIQEILELAKGGAWEISLVPEYRDRSFVPARIKIDAGQEHEPSAYNRQISVW